MIICPHQQGTKEWHDFRANHFSASLAPIMMGVSKNVSREKLLHMMATGDEQEFSSFQQKILDKGHEIEEAARPIAKNIIGQELYRVTASDDNKYLSASYDGLTMDQNIAWECKQFNKNKVADVQADKIPEEDFWQVVQQCAIGPDKCMYTVSNGTEEGSYHTWYERNENDINQLIAGWAQFEADLEALKAKIASGEYEPPAKEAIGETQTDLPAVYVQVSGEISLQDNLTEFGERLNQFVDEHLIIEPETDEDFATLAEQIKTLKKAEEALNAAEAAALAQVASIDEMKHQKEALHGLARKNRLMAEKLVEAKKKEIRVKIISEAEQSLDKFVNQINETLEGVFIECPKVDFAAAIKGKRTVTSVREAAAQATANAKINVSNSAELIRINLKALDKIAGDYKFLFSDLQQLINNPREAFEAMVKLRISEHKEAEEKRLEKEREKIREEEEQKAKQETQPVVGKINGIKYKDRWIIQCPNGFVVKEYPIDDYALHRSPFNTEDEAKIFIDKGYERRQTDSAETPDHGHSTSPETGFNASPGVSHEPKQPTTEEIVTVVAQHFKVARSVALNWIKSI